MNRKTSSKTSPSIEAPINPDVTITIKTNVRDAWELQALISKALGCAYCSKDDGAVNDAISRIRRDIVKQLGSAIAANLSK